MEVTRERTSGNSFRRKTSYLLERTRKAYPAAVRARDICDERNIGRSMRSEMVRWLREEGHVTQAADGSIRATPPPAGAIRAEWERPRF